MFQLINHKPALSVAMLLMLALFTQLLAPPVAIVIARTTKTESALNETSSNDANGMKQTRACWGSPRPSSTAKLDAATAPAISATLSAKNRPTVGGANDQIQAWNSGEARER